MACSIIEKEEMVILQSEPLDYRLMEGERDQNSSGRGDEEEDGVSDWSDEPERMSGASLPKERRMCIMRW